MNDHWEQIRRKRDSISLEIDARWGNKLPARVRKAMRESGFSTLAELKHGLETDFRTLEVELLRLSGIGRDTLKQMMSALDLSLPKVDAEDPVLDRRYITTTEGGLILTDRERQLIRRMIAGVKHLYDEDYESELLDELITLRNKL